jgi:3-isopropylmalate/(R)-2-methylmalate dehydratase small subunit
VECPEAVEAFKEGDAIAMDVAKGTITVGGRAFSFPPLPPEMLAIRDAGGLLPYARKRLRETKGK